MHIDKECAIYINKSPMNGCLNKVMAIYAEMSRKPICLALSWPTINEYVKSAHFQSICGNKENVVFFDMDNTLYAASTGIDSLMKHRIELYCQKLGLSEQESKIVGLKYYSTYGLAVRGFLQHHSIDPVEYDNFVDGGLPLKDKLFKNRPLIELLSRINGQKWVFTNAGINHATRVLNLLGLFNSFDGILYCDYSIPDFHCKPESPVFEMAMKATSFLPPKNYYFFDDSIKNVQQAALIGWNVAYVHEDSNVDLKIVPLGAKVISKIEELKDAFPELINHNK